MYSTDANCQQNKKGVFCYTFAFGMYSNKTVAIPTSMTYVRRNKDICIVPYESVSSYIGLFTTKKGSFVVPLVCTYFKQNCWSERKLPKCPNLTLSKQKRGILLHLWYVLQTKLLRNQQKWHKQQGKKTKIYCGSKREELESGHCKNSRRKLVRTER